LIEKELKKKEKVHKITKEKCQKRIRGQCQWWVVANGSQ